MRLRSLNGPLALAGRDSLAGITYITSINYDGIDVGGEERSHDYDLGGIHSRIIVSFGVDDIAARVAVVRASDLLSGELAC